MRKKVFFSVVLIFFVFILSGCNNKPTAPTIEDKTVDKKEAIIVNGNIVEKNNITKIIVDKKDFTKDYIQEFTEVYTSPDGNFICFLGKTLVPVWLFTANSDGTKPEKIAVAKNCVWSHDNQKVAYNNHTTDVSPVNVLIYDISLKKEINLTKKIQQKNLIKVYELPEWFEDDNKITSRFTALDFNNLENKIEGISIINLITGEITEK